MLLGILPNVPGFLTTTGIISKDAVWSWVSSLYNYAWFVGFFVSGIAYLLMMKAYPSRLSGTEGRALKTVPDYRQEIPIKENL